MSALSPSLKPAFITLKYPPLVSLKRGPKSENNFDVADFEFREEITSLLL